MIMFWRRRKNFLMDWTNALHQASGTMTISVGSKKKWKPRLNCSCVCFNTHLFCFLTHLALWLTVNVFLGERCGENSHLKRPLKEHWSVQLQVGEKKHVKLKLILKHCGELHMFMTLFHIIRKLWYDNVSEKIDHGFEYKVLYLEHFDLMFPTQGTLKRAGAQYWVRLCANVSQLSLVLLLLGELWGPLLFKSSCCSLQGHQISLVKLLINFES